MASESTQSITTEMREIGGRVADQARDQLDRVKEGASDLIEQGRERFEQMEQSLEEYVVENPLKSILISVGVGLLVGRFVLR